MRNDLATQNSQFIAVMGQQGIGKTALRNAFENFFGDEAVSTQWLGTEAFFQQFEPLWDSPSGKLYVRFLNEILCRFVSGEDLAFTNPVEILLKKLPEYQVRAIIHFQKTGEIREFEMPTGLSLLKVFDAGLGGVKGRRQFVRDFLTAWLSHKKVLLIDLRNYDRKDRTPFNKRAPKSLFP
ncbi:MAG: hypothetical protein ABSD73_02745 [Candidatus Bathyarchaeia archaeon]